MGVPSASNDASVADREGGGPSDERAAKRDYRITSREYLEHNIGIANRESSESGGVDVLNGSLATGGTDSSRGCRCG